MRTDLVSAPIAAQRLGIDVRTLRNWARNGDVDFIETPSGRMYFDPAVIDALADRLHSTASVSS